MKNIKAYFLLVGLISFFLSTIPTATSFAASSKPSIYSSCSKSGLKSENLKCGILKGVKGYRWLPTTLLGNFSSLGDSYGSNLKKINKSESINFFNLYQGGWVFQNSSQPFSNILSFANSDGTSSEETIEDLAIFPKWSGSIRSHQCDTSSINCRLGSGRIFTIVDSKNKRTDIEWPNSGDLLIDEIQKSGAPSQFHFFEFQIRFSGDQNNLVIRECDSSSIVFLTGEGETFPNCAIKTLNLVTHVQKTILMTYCANSCHGGGNDSYVRGLVVNDNDIFTVLCQKVETLLDENSFPAFVYTTSGPLTGNCSLIKVKVDSMSIKSTVQQQNQIVGSYETITPVGSDLALYNLQEWTINKKKYVTYVTDNSYSIRNLNTTADSMALDGDLVSYIDQYKLNSNGNSNQACIVDVAAGTVNCFLAPTTTPYSAIDYFSLVWPTSNKGGPKYAIMFQSVESDDGSDSGRYNKFTILKISDGSTSDMRTKCDEEDYCSAPTDPFAVPTRGFAN